MRCEKCKAETVVKDSRPKDKSIRRRRECLRCGHRFFTMEVLEAKPDLKIVPKQPPNPKRKLTKGQHDELWQCLYEVAEMRPKYYEPEIMSLVDCRITSYKHNQ